MLAEVFQMLKALSFKEKEARRLVDAARPHVGAEMTAEQALRVALRGVSIGSGVREELAEYGGSAPTWGLMWSTAMPAPASNRNLYPDKPAAAW
ncbi:MAG: hypothetical protein SangKO_044380 [Sandaracinaceae bacterium]